MERQKLVNYFFGILKLIFAIVLIPFAIAITFNFFRELNLLTDNQATYFEWGIFSYLLLHIFLYEPVIVYNKGKRVLEIVFKFFAPLIKIASFCLPIYTIFILIVLSLYKVISKDAIYINYFIFLVSFFLTLHIIFTAKTLRSKETDFLKSSYFFFMTLIYIINVIIVASVFSLMFSDFSFLDFFNTSYLEGKQVYSSIFHKLFLVE